MKNQMIGKKGITLIALVITIIVLLILAGVTIATLTGDNGLLQKATTAKQSSKEAEIREKISLAVTAAKTNNSGMVIKESLDEELIKELGENNYKIIVVGNGYIIIVDNIQYKIEENGSVQNINRAEEHKIENAGDLSKGGQYDGLTEETAYRVACIEDLVEWTDKYNNYQSLYIKLDKTLDFNSPSSYKDYEAKTTDINGNGKIEELITELTTKTGFKPIVDFSGTFDGQNNEIKNIYENRTGDAGLFATLSGATISNLGVIGKIIGTSNVGGIAGTRPSNSNATVNINKCNFSGYLKGGNAGGILGGYKYTGCCLVIEECYNLGYIEGECAGGIVGYERKCTIRNSYNLGNVKGNTTGGILGYVNGASGIIDVYNSYNSGNISSNSSAGGIIGYSYAGGTMKNIYNTGNVNPIGNNPFYTKISYSYPSVENGFYIDNIDVKGMNVINDTTTSFNKEYIKSQEIVNKLNEYVETYNEEHKNDKGFISLKRWKYNEGNYPTFE